MFNTWTGGTWAGGDWFDWSPPYVPAAVPPTYAVILKRRAGASWVKTRVLERAGAAWVAWEVYVRIGSEWGLVDTTGE